MPEVPTEQDLIDLVRAHSSVLQFKNSIKFVQGSTSMSLERMDRALDLMAAKLYADGMARGMAIAKDITLAVVKDKEGAVSGNVKA